MTRVVETLKQRRFCLEDKRERLVSELRGHEKRVVEIEREIDSLVDECEEIDEAIQKLS